MEVLQTLAVALGLAALSGYSLYLTVFLTGLAIHFDWIHLAPQYASLSVLGEPTIIIISGVLFVLEFFVDKIPGSTRSGTLFTPSSDPSAAPSSPFRRWVTLSRPLM